MADLNVTKYSTQFQYTGDGPLDTKQTPIRTVDELPSRLKAYEGQTVTVLNAIDNKPYDYQFINGEWRIKIPFINGGEF